jgi:hypothetical protein
MHTSALSVSDWKNKALRLKSQLDNFRETGLEIAERGANVTLTTAGGVAAALASVYLPTIPGTQVPTDLAVGGAIAALGVFDLLGGMADQCSSFGGGLLAVGVFRTLEPQIRQRAAA